MAQSRVEQVTMPGKIVCDEWYAGTRQPYQALHPVVGVLVISPSFPDFFCTVQPWWFTARYLSKFNLSDFSLPPHHRAFFHVHNSITLRWVEIWISFLGALKEVLAPKNRNQGPMAQPRIKRGLCFIGWMIASNVLRICASTTEPFLGDRYAGYTCTCAFLGSQFLFQPSQLKSLIWFAALNPAGCV
jgi:hypothetical protein